MGYIEMKIGSNFEPRLNCVKTAHMIYFDYITFTVLYVESNGTNEFVLI